MSMEFEDSDDFDLPEAGAGGGWRKAFRLAISRYKGAGIVLFATGFSGTILEVIAYGSLLSAISTLESGSDGPIPFMPAGLLSGVPEVGIVGIASAFLLLMLFSALLYYFNGRLVARYRRESFRDMIKRTIVQIDRFPDAEYVTTLGTRGLGRALRRECRYVSRAVTDILTLPRQAVTLLAIVVLGARYYPIVVAIAVAIASLSLPFHIAVGRWGSQTMAKLIRKGAAKSEADRRVIETLRFPTNFTNDAQNSEKLAADHADGDVVSGFLDTYRDRMLLSPISQFVSRMMAFLIVTGVGFYIGVRWESGSFTLAEIVLVIIAFRMAATSLSSLIQGVVVVASYSPIINGILDFLYLDKRPHQSKLGPAALKTEDGKPLPKRFFWIGGSELNQSIVRRINALWVEDDADVFVIAGSASAAPHLRPIDMSALENWLQGYGAAFSPELKAQLQSAASGTEGATDAGRAMLAYWQCAAHKTPFVHLFWDSKSFMNLAQGDRSLLLGMLGDHRLCVFHVSTPKRLSPMLDGNIFRLDGLIARRVDLDSPTTRNE